MIQSCSIALAPTVPYSMYFDDDEPTLVMTRRSRPDDIEADHPAVAPTGHYAPSAPTLMSMKSADARATSEVDWGDIVRPRATGPGIKAARYISQRNIPTVRRAVPNDGPIVTVLLTLWALTATLSGVALFLLA